MSKEKQILQMLQDGYSQRRIASTFPQAIEAVFPETEIQQCIIHQIRNTTKFVSYKELKPLMADLKRVYAAPTEEIALAELDSFDEKWSGKYPKIAKSWKDNWANLSTYFKYPEAVRRLIYLYHEYYRGI